MDGAGLNKQQREAKRAKLMQLLKATPKELGSAAARSAQRDARHEHIRFWRTALIPFNQVVRMAMNHFGLKRRTCQLLIMKLEAQWKIEAQVFDERPRHEQRHNDRMAIEHVIRKCIDAGRYSVALRGLELLTKVNGTQQPNQVEVSGGLELWRSAAKGLSVAELHSIATSGEAITIQVPVPPN